MIITIFLLSTAFLICAVFLILLKRDVRLLNRRLQTILRNDTNMRVTTETFDQDICRLSNTINTVLDKQKKTAMAGEKSNRELRQALTNISHDLRTPLTSAMGYVQLIASEKTPEDKRQEYLTVIEDRLKALSGLIDKLFEYTQIMEGKLTQNIEKVNLCNIFRDTVASFYDAFMEKDFTVQMDIPDEPVYMLGGEASLKRIAQNLIQNVLAHGMEQFSLVVDAKGNKITLKNKVKDIESVEVERLFERFYTADFSRISTNIGLGLAIAKELITNMGGEISGSIEHDLLCICICF